MKKLFLSVFILIGTFALMACGNQADKFMEELSSEKNVYAISAVSGVEETIDNLDDEITEENNSNDPIQEENKLDSLLGLLNDDLFNVEELSSDNENYTNLLEICLNGKTYLFYFNETLLEREEDNDEIEKEFEVNEYQYEYSIYESNKEILTIELEVEDDEIELTIETNDDEHEYIIEKIDDNNFKIIYDEEVEFTLIIDLNNKKYIYTYNNQTIVK